MKKSQIVFFTALVVVLAGAILMWLGLRTMRYTGGGDALQREATYLGCTALEITTGESDVTIRAVDREDVKVSCWEMDGLTWSCAQEPGGTLRLKAQGEWQWFRFPFGEEERLCRLDIEVPLNFDGAVTLSTTSGDVEVSGLTLEEDCTMATFSGEIELKNCTTSRDLTVSATSGNVALKECMASQTLTVSTTSGEVEVKNTAADRGISVSTTSGDVKLTGVESGAGAVVAQTSGDLEGDTLRMADGFTLSHSSGDTFLRDVTARALESNASSGGLEGTRLTLDTATAQATSGDIRLEMTGRQSDYTIRTSTTSGDCNLPEQAAGGSGLLDLSTTSGTIRVEFGG